jgi:hypothetical protein
MLKTIIMAMLMLLPMFTIAQTESKTIYIIDSYHNRSCFGGNGICSESTIEFSKEKTTASVSLISNTQLKVELIREGFTSKDWEILQTEKVFPVDNNSNIRLGKSILNELVMGSKFNIIKPNNYPVLIKEDKAIFIIELLEH